MKREELFNQREVELMENYYRENRPLRENLLKFIGIVDKDEAKKGLESTAYMQLDPLLNDEMLEVLNVMKLRKAVYVDALAKKAGKSVEQTAQIVDELAHIGVVEYKTDSKGIDMIEVPIFCVGQLEMIMVTPKYYDEHPEQAVLFQHFTHESSTGKGFLLPMSNHGVHRPVPIESALTSDVKRMSWEQLSTLIENNKGQESYAIAPCMCRKSFETLGKGTGEPNLYWCMPIGHFAEYCIRVGKAKRVTKQEFLDHLKKAEELGYVHNVANANGKDEIEYICNCDYRSCFEFRAALTANNASIIRSNFTAQVDPNACVACGRCVEKCPMNAVKLGQRLEPKSPKQYHYNQTPHQFLKWEKERHHMDYGFERTEVWKETGTAPCKTACPAHIGVEGYLRLTALGRYDDALALIKHNNPLPAVCGAICNRRCETVCTRGKIDQPVAIDEVKKFIAYRELKKENRYVPKKIHDKGKKIAVIGSGPAGISCAYYSAVNGHQVTVFEKNEQIGGMLRYGIPSFRLEKDIVDAEIDVLKTLGVEFRTEIEIGKNISIKELRKQGYKAFYVAIGMQGGRRLGVPGEDVEGVVSGVSFMRNTAKNGKGACTGKVVVVGGGNVAVDVARTALRSGAVNVQQFCLETCDVMPAAIDEVEEAEAEGIIINCGWGPKEILSNDGKVTGIVFKKCVSVFDEEHRFNPKYDENNTVMIEADYILTSIGQSIEWGNLLKDMKVELNRNGTAKADNFTYQTAEPDVFVGGDAYTGARFAIDAIAAGKEAAESIQRYVWNGSLTFGRNRQIYQEIDKDDVVYGSYDNSDRQQPGKNVKKKLSFSDDREIFTEEQVRKETARCLKCGASHVDENMCIGCGVCTTRCEFDAIHIRKVFNETPVPREKLVPDVLKEVGRRMIWTKFHKPTEASAQAGMARNDWTHSMAIGAAKKVDYQFGGQKGVPKKSEVRDIMCTKCTEYVPKTNTNLEDEKDWMDNEWAHSVPLEHTVGKEL